MARQARRERIEAAFTEFHGAVSAAFGAAAQLRDRAAQRHAELMVELWLRETGLDAAAVDPRLRGLLHNPRVAAAVARVAADRDAAFDDWLGADAGPQRLAALMERHAPEAAGDVRDWLDEVGLGEVGKVDGNGTVPQLWRIGTGTVGAVAGEAGAGRAAASFPVGVPLLDESHLQVLTTLETRAVAESLVESLLLRTVSYFRPGLVHLHVWDVGRFTGTLPGLFPLTRTGLLTVHDPGNLDGLLTELSDRIRRVHTRVLMGGYPSLKALAANGGLRTEPWVVAVLLGDHRTLDDDDEQQVQRVLRGGLACGVSVVLLDLPMTIAAPLERVVLRPVAPGSAREIVTTTTLTGDHVRVVPDPPLPREAITRACHAVADEHERLRSRVGVFRDLLPPEEHWGRGNAKSGLCAPVGFVEGVPFDVVLGDASPHALIGGPSGSGKTNLLLTLIASLAARYPPDQLELHLLDFKEGVSFAQFAPGRSDGTWLPHARLIGVNINTDREFGLALLRHLAGVMRERAEVAKQHEVTKLEELPDAVRGPRIVAVIDEFQYLFAENDSVTREATALLEDVARRGRSQGIHLVLASQDVSGISAFWGRPSIFEQFVLRIGLPRARRVLAVDNDATLDLPRWHAIINHESGIAHDNRAVRIADASRRGTVDEVQRPLHVRYGSHYPRPVLFDGSRAPAVDELVGRVVDVRDRTGADDAVPSVLVGQRIDVAGSPATVPLPAFPGRNLAVLGAGSTDALRVLAGAAASLARAHPPGAARFVLAPLVASVAAGAAEAAAKRLEGHDVTTVWLDGFREAVERLAGEVVARLSNGLRSPVYLVMWAADAADAVLERSGTEALRQVLRFGPETGVHVVGWWRSPLRLKALLLTTASLDDVGAFVGLDVQGTELGNLISPGVRVPWAPRPGRGLFFDRGRHAQPEVVIVPAADPDPADAAGEAR